MRYSETVVENRRSELTLFLFEGSVGVTTLEFFRYIWHRQSRVPGLSYGVVCVILGLTTFVELRLRLRLLTDGRRDRQTDVQTMTAYTALKRSVVRLCVKKVFHVFFKPSLHQQQRRSNIVECYKSNDSFDNVECCFDQVACCFDIVAGVDGALSSRSVKQTT